MSTWPHAQPCGCYWCQPYPVAGVRVARPALAPRDTYQIQKSAGTYANEAHVSDMKTATTKAVRDAAVRIGATELSPGSDVGIVRIPGV